jgi:serine/threonine protein kinase
MQLSTALKHLLGKTDVARRIGPFQLVRALGRGGQAPVWLAREVYGDTELRLAAVKLFSLGAAEQGEGSWSRATSQLHKARVIEEAKALCRVEHPNIVRFYSMASDETSSVLGVAMEYLPGASLEARIAERGCLSLDDTLALGASIASALSTVHAAGLVHRDIKPANIVDSAGTFKLIDFGIAWEEPEEPRIVPVLVDDLPLEVSSEERSHIPGAVTFRAEHDSKSGPRSGPRLHTGTPGYVDPACLRFDEPTTFASDLYALGVVLYECSSGRHPAAVAAKTGEGLQHQVLIGAEPAPSLGTLLPNMPKSFSALVDQMLSAKPSARPRSADWVAVQLERIRAESAGRARKLPPESVGPFRGLGRFEEGDRDLYFGRSSEVAAALELMRANGLVSLVGPSGSGKSSLARAGVLPRVRDNALGRGFVAWDVAVVSPGSDPKQALLRALAELPEPPVDAARAARGDIDPSDVVAALVTRAQSSSRGVVVFVDQLEELVTMSGSDGGESRRWTVELLALLGQSTSPGVRGLVTARRDLLDPILSIHGLGKVVVRGTLLVEPMTDAIWIEVVEQALEAYGYGFEDDALEAELAGQLKGGASAMPLVQFALTELWNKRDATKEQLTRAGLEAIGGIAGSLERHAERTLRTIAETRPTAAIHVRDVLLALTTPQGTRATMAEEELTRGDADRVAVVRVLLQARLVVSGDGGVTLAHDALLVQWGRLRAWLAEVRDERLLGAELERDAKRWAADPEGVAPWRKGRLASGLALAPARRVRVSETAHRFLQAGRVAERRTRIGALAISLVVVVLGATTGVTYVLRARANEAAAMERAAHEASRASLELSRREELERSQSELDGRQKKIDELVAQLSQATDPKMIEDVQRRMKEEQAGAHKAQQRIVATRPSASPPAASPPAGSPAAPTGPKVQREDDDP